MFTSSAAQEVVLMDFYGIFSMGFARPLQSSSGFPPCSTCTLSNAAIQFALQMGTV